MKFSFVNCPIEVVRIALASKRLAANFKQFKASAPDYIVDVREPTDAEKPT
jgi:hypothetical protein